MRRSILILFCLCIAIGIFGQVFNTTNDSLLINQLDSLGNKSGFWVENDYLKYYTNNNLNGPILSFEERTDNSSMIISVLLSLINNKESGSQMFFHPNGVVALLLVNVSPNVDFIGAQKHYLKDAVFPYQTYCYEFYTNGKLKAKGWAILGEDLEIDNERVGVWQYYELDGKEESVDFSKDGVKYCPYL